MGLINKEAQIALAILGSSSDEKLISMIKEIGCEHTKEEIDGLRDCLKLIGIDVECLTEGWSEDEIRIFDHTVMMWALSLRDTNDAITFLLMMRHFMTSERKKNMALMQMVRTLSGEDKEKTENEDE